MNEEEQLATVDAPECTVAWYDSVRAPIIPKKFILCKIVSCDKKRVSYLLDLPYEAALLDFLRSRGCGVKTGSKQERTGGRSTRTDLGICPRNAFGSDWHHNKKGFPPLTTYTEYKCQSVDFHPNHVAITARESHIERGTECKYRFVIRHFGIGNKSLITFEEDETMHICSGINAHLLPVTPHQKLTFFQGVLACSSIEEFHEKYIVKMAESCLQEGRRANRFEVMTLAEARKLARALGIDKSVRQGADDFQHVRERLEKIATEGGTFAFKLPGWSVDNPSAVLEPSAKPFLKQEDLFIFAMTKLQSRLLQKLGKMVSTDGTHMVFSYKNIKLIAVLVSSFSTSSAMKERGFAVALALTTSEREDVHKAIVVHLKAGAKDWTPELLMTDMAFSAFNAWKTFFPELRWLWCVFHVWQAWIKRLRTTQRPEGLTKNEWSLVKSFLIREIKNLICPKGDVMTLEEFRAKCKLVSDVMWRAELMEVATCFDGYVKNENLWAPPSRCEVVTQLWQSCQKMPMLAKSNNALEAFFGVLKHHILQGKSVMTADEFFRIWEIYMLRIFSNAVKSHVLDDLQMQGATSVEAAEVQEFNPFEILDETEEDEIDPSNRSDDDGDVRSQDSDTEDESAGHEAPLEDFDTLRERLQVQAKQKAIQEFEIMEKVHLRKLAELRENFAGLSETQLKGLTRSMANWNIAADAVLSDERLSTSSLSVANQPQGFQIQRTNFGSSPFSRTGLIEPQVPADISGAGRSSGSMNAQHVPSILDGAGSSAIAQADLESLQKKKRRKLVKDLTRESRFEMKTFEEFAQEFLGSDAAARIQEAKRKSVSKSLPLLRGALSWNTVNRIRAIALDVFHQTFPQSISKQELIDRLITHIESIVPSLTAEAAAAVADVGVVHCSGDHLIQKEVVFIRTNATTNSTGESCVSACENLCGWTLRNGTLVQVDIVDIQAIYWGRLSEKRKGVCLVEDCN